MSDNADRLLARAYALNNPEESRTLYRDWAKTYDKTMLEGLGYLTPAKTAKLLDDYVEGNSGKVLDVGAGTGLAGLELTKLGWSDLEALDYSAEMLGVAEARGVYRKTIQADLTKRLPLEDDCYDAQVCTGTFTHAHVGADCMDELLRVLKPGGTMACTIHKDVYGPAGFEAKLAEMDKIGELEILHQQSGSYFIDGADDEGWYFLWRKAAYK